MRTTFDLYVGGEAKGLKARLGQLLLSGLQEEQLVPLVTSILSFYQTAGKPREKFSRFVDRITLEKLRVQAIG
ncbi:hypothetical protein J31TS4_11260 [Paenibacillus sp. J31TS4]|uniref:hypothetical protein n=1 Tax=Paenibacillus sp. J31TS4 TaxID=2807195 RepID=UPI001B1AD3B7|nr:hypothetical protein [Paenibacillus sp. J31TS4]GIP37846.1 hypothetical protein J31TS4_11260 [Paenibacillus sp. J31TS4]